jgi:hypothetical protein
VAAKALTVAFEGYVTIQKPTVVFLDDAEFGAAMDKIYGAGTYKKLTSKGSRIRGFNDNKTNTGNYINKKYAETKTVLHEMLHANTNAEWKALGQAYNEGMTETLAIEACTLNNIKMCKQTYPSERGIIAATAAAGVSMSTMKAAYFMGGTDGVKDGITKKCKGTWVQVKAALDAGDFAAALAKLAKK